MAGQKWRLLWLVFSLQYGLIGAYDTSIETALLEELFNSSTYNSFVRPSDIVNVTVRFTVLSLNELNIKSQTMHISGYLEVGWDDPRLSWSGLAAYSGILASTVNEDTVWYPPLSIVNSVNDLQILYDGITPVRMFPGGQMEWLPLRNFELHCDTNPMYYPFDTQNCPIAITVWTYTTSLVNLEAATGDVFNLDFYHENGEWEYVSSAVTTETVERAGHETLTLIIAPKFRRRPQFFVMNTIIPILLLAILNGFIFSLSVESGEKVGFVLTVLLAYAVYLTLVSDHIPTTSDNTSILSILVLMVLMMSVISVIVTIYVIRLSGRSDEVPISDTTRRLTQMMARSTFWGGCRRRKKQVHVEEDNTNGVDKTDVDNTPKRTPEKSWVQEISTPDDEWENLTWKEVADIIDHFCFVWYFIATTIVSGCCIILMLYGYNNYKT
ncbi:acetylcholine receptor subunit alpha-1-A-like isoform X2 [Pecten maximus]|uniref:acetylcholine receptor subunit alpha-1-A-like isoform X2 n=1 Tax=Pecten maximus TaxID=6579 RepID=UPI001458FAD2|nr:acetylcholine receptor subunit alpha-1-A-like isoform X2 [Pecten maximus]